MRESTRSQQKMDFVQYLCLLLLCVYVFLKEFILTTKNICFPSRPLRLIFLGCSFCFALFQDRVELHVAFNYSCLVDESTVHCQ